MQKHLLYVIPPPPQKKEDGDVIYGWSHRNKTAKVSLQFLQQTRWLLSRSEKKRCKRQSHQKKNIYFTPEKEGEFFQLKDLYIFFSTKFQFYTVSQWSDIGKTYICMLIQDRCILHTYIFIDLALFDDLFTFLSPKSLAHLNADDTKFNGYF